MLNFVIRAIASERSWLVAIFVWLAVITTIYSGLEYILAAARILGREK